METPELVELLRQFASKGINLGDINKAIKELKTEGVLKAQRGKLPSDDPIRLAVKDALLAAKVKTADGGESTLLSVVEGAAGEAVSFMLTLSDNWKVNFVKSVPRKKKETKNTKEEAPKEFAEPTIS